MSQFQGDFWRCNIYITKHIFLSQNNRFLNSSDLQFHEIILSFDKFSSFSK